VKNRISISFRIILLITFVLSLVLGLLLLYVGPLLFEYRLSEAVLFVISITVGYMLLILVFERSVLRPAWRLKKVFLAGNEKDQFEFDDRLAWGELDELLKGISHMLSQLKSDNERTRAILDHTDQFMGLLSTSGILVDVNKSVLKSSGVGAYDVIDKPFAEAPWWAHSSFLRNEIQQAITMAVRGKVICFEVSYPNANGDLRWIDLSFHPVTGKDEKVEFVMLEGHDVTARRKTEEALRQSGERFKSIITVSNTGAWEYRQVDNHLWCSPEYFTMLGYCPDMFMNQGRVNLKEAWMDLLHPDDRERASNHFKNYLENGPEGMYENYFRMKHSNGSWIWIWSRGQSLRNKDGSLTGLYVGTHIDITDQKKAEQDLIDYKNNLEVMVEKRTRELFEKTELIEQQNEELNQAIKHLKEAQLKLVQSEKMASLGTLTAGVAHEINNPLNFIKGAQLGLEQYFKDYGSAEQEKTDILQDSISVGVDRISGIVKGLNLFSRNNDKLDEECAIHSVIDNCLAMLFNSYKHKIEIKKTFFHEEILVRGNVGKLHQVFINVLTNAIQAIEEQGVIYIRTMILTDSAVVEIRDNGVGMDERTMAQVTDPFFTTKPPGEGIGLGLSIAYTIISDHGGKLDFESKIKEGTQVVISFPGKNILSPVL
jgi:PAS domain S-box-containing protein